MTTKQGIALNIHNINKYFGDRHIIQNLELNIQSGEFVAVVGRSGCGKSTLLRLLAQLDPLTSGEIVAENLSGPELKQNTRMMFQEPRLLPWKNVMANVGLGLSGNWKPLAKKALSDVGLLDRANEWPAQLSGGQKQRVALARALIHQPKLLLLDEPLGALDALTRLDMQQLIVKLWQYYGFTVVLVTHDINEAVLTANRVLLIEEGKIDLNLPIKLSHPRLNLTELAHLEQKILDRILNLPPVRVDFVI